MKPMLSPDLARMAVIRFGLKLVVAAMSSAALLLVSALATALPLVDYPHARVMFSSESSPDDYRLALGSMEKINNRWLAEREERLSGQLQSQTLAIDSGHSANEVYNYYVQQLKQLRARELFRCSGRACGSSNSWANNHFNVKNLYGLDDHQRYSAYEVMAENGTRVYVSLYAVKRGNKRELLQFERLTTDDQLSVHSTPEVIVAALREGESFVLPDLDWQNDRPDVADTHLKSLTRALQLQRGWQVAIVGHDFRSAPEANLQTQSQHYATFVRDRLIAMGIGKERLQAYGIGSLAPSVKVAAGASRTVTVVKISD